MSAPLEIYLLSKNLSSWSLRPWLALEHTGAPYTEVTVALDRPDTAARIREHSPSGRLPALRHGELLVWDSFAIGEYLHELFPAAKLWPDDRAARTHGRSIAAEMHAGFPTLRKHMPMDVSGKRPGEGRAPGVDEEIARIVELWRHARARHGAGGPFLLGAFSLADCFYAPVCTRFVTYDVTLPPEARAYVDAVIALPAMKKWAAAAALEPK